MCPGHRHRRWPFFSTGVQDMVVLLIAGDLDEPQSWHQALVRALPGHQIRLWPELGAVDEIEFAVVWEPPSGALAHYPNLRAIFALGAGVDSILGDPDLPADVPVVRLTDPELARQMSEYVVLEVLRHHRRFPAYGRQQADLRWRQLPPPETSRRRVGIMGLGVLGKDAIKRLKPFGFPLSGWSRRRKRLQGVRTFHGPDGFEPFLGETDILVCLLPLTAQTEGILDAKALAALPADAVVINCARGGLIGDDDLIAALDSGHLDGATLDVFDTEPLPPEHPFWTHPKITVTPHIAAMTLAPSAAAMIAENIRRLEAGEALTGLVDRNSGY